MIEIEGPGSNLAKMAGGGIAKTAAPLTIGQLELALLARFPREDAEPWDRTGLLVGDPARLVTGVVVALDPTAAAIQAAVRAGADVVLTHHPAFLDPPESFTTSYELSGASGVNVFNAAKQGVALMSFHTALDASPDVAKLLPRMLNLDLEGVLAPLPHDERKGFGSLCVVKESERPFKLEHLAARCLSVFGRQPRVWGDLSASARRVAIANGSGSGFVGECLSARADCLVCGEIRYHTALDAMQAGLAVIELGHDVSELPLTAVLASATIEAGVDASTVSVFDQSGNWTTPDSTRL